MLGEGTVLFGAFAGRGPGRVASNCLELFVQFPGNEDFYLSWVPPKLRDDPRQARAAKCGELLRALEAMQRNHFRHIITGDENWFYLEYQHASQWSVSGDEVTERGDPPIGTNKFVLTTIWGINGIHLLDVIPSEYTPRLNLHLDNFRIQFSKVTEQFFIENQLLHVPHPPYSPDLAL
jgi:hypothetical protein